MSEQLCVTRRAVLYRGACGIGVVAGGSALAWADRLAAQTTEQRVSEDEPLAQQLMYVHDAAHAAEGRGEDEFCHNCQFFRAAADPMWSPCDIFGGREVNANGWCNVWVMRPA